MKLVVRSLEQEIFKPFGRVLEPWSQEIPEVTEPGAFDFFVLFKESATSWQVGYLEQKADAFCRLECHPNTPEVFVPLKGESVIVLANTPVQQGQITAFRLDKPVVLNCGVWHGVISLDGLSEILIVENSDVIDEYFDLEKPIDVSVLG
ncbi:MAG TPA: hypothetical protein GX721_09675 [Firmicutes bacterium]|jgi:ureidoglycolate hydrolase|nr:hypothetical protein [Bacillota bacterium]